MHVLIVIAVIDSIALGQYLLLHGVKFNFREASVLVPLRPVAAQDLLEGPPHVLVPEAVDDGVDEGVALCQHQTVFLGA